MNLHVVGLRVNGKIGNEPWIGSRSWARLQRMAQDDLSWVVRANLYTPTDGEIVKLDWHDLRERAWEYISKADLGDQIVFCSSSIGRSLGIKNMETYPAMNRDMDLVMVHVLPHPSGTNRFWNNPPDEERATRFFRRIVENCKEEE